MAAPVAPPGAAPSAPRWSSRPRRRLTTPAVVRRPWPVAAVPDAGPGGGSVPVDGAIPGAVAIPGVPLVRLAPVAPGVPPTVLLDAGAARTDVTGTRLPAPLILMRSAGAGASGVVTAVVPASPPRAGAAPPRRAPIRRGHVPGTPVRASRAVWGPPQPAS